MNTQELTEIITKEVLNILSKNETPFIKDNRPAILVLGEAKKIPREWNEKYHVVDGKTLTVQEFGLYEKIVITELTMTQLSDIALCRDNDIVSKTVLLALLNGCTIEMLYFAPFHRSFEKNTKSIPIFNRLEEYVKDLERMGISILKQELITERKEESNNKKMNNISCEKLITEAVALRMVRNGKLDFQFKKDTIITPSAKDVFLQNRIEIQFI